MKHNKMIVLFMVTICWVFIASDIYAVGAEITKSSASSIESPKLKVENAFDGDMSTRWGSKFSESEWISADFGKKININKVILYWENAYAKAYKIQVSLDGKTWKDIYSTDNGDGNKDEIEFDVTSARYMRVSCIKRGLDWAGYSLFEIKIFQVIPGTLDKIKPGTQKVLDNFEKINEWLVKVPVVSAEASSTESISLLPENASDGDMGTRWGSLFKGDQWISFDLGQKREISKTVLYWETAFAESYKLQISDNGKEWKDIYVNKNSDGGRDEIDMKKVSTRYIRVLCTKRGLDWAGYSLFEADFFSHEAAPDIKLETKKDMKGNCIEISNNNSKKIRNIKITRDLLYDLPENYKITFFVKGGTQCGALELKCHDFNGNTFSRSWNNYVFTRSWRKLEIKKDEFKFVTGPDPESKLDKIKRVEFVFKDQGDGEGKIFVDEISLEALPVLPQSVSLLKNPSFEMEFKNWEQNGNAKFVSCLPFHIYKGKKSLGIGNDEGPDRAYAEITQDMELPFKLKTGDIFIYNMYVFTEDKYTGEADIKIDFTDNNNKILKSYQSDVINTKSDWQKLSVCGETPENTKHVRVKCISKNMKTGQGSSFAWFDNGNVISPVVTASSYSDDDHRPEQIFLKGSWHSNPDKSQNEWISIDFRNIQSFSGISIDWDKDYAGDYEILVSKDSKNWKKISEFRKNTPGPDVIYMDGTYAKCIKIRCISGNGSGFGIKNIIVKQLNALVNLRDYYQILAKRNPGCYSRWMFNQEAYWTSAGVYGDVNEAALCEDGTLEPFKRGFTIMPLIYTGNKLLNREDAEITHWLEDTYLPIPNVNWKTDNVSMNVKLFVSGDNGKSIAYCEYDLSNISSKKRAGKLFLTIRPFQVYPPWQGGTDGMAPIYNIKYLKDHILIDDVYRIFPLEKPDESGSVSASDHFRFPFKVPPPPELKGDIISYIKGGKVPPKQNIEDNGGFASSVIAYNFNLKPGEHKTFHVAIPLHKTDPEITNAKSGSEINKTVKTMLVSNKQFWKSKIENFDIDIPEMDLVYFAKANIGYNLVSRDGPSLQPGCRSYDKAWWRDGSIQASSLMKMGLMEEPRKFIEWMISFQYQSGEAPPIIDNKSADPLWELRPPINLKEYDSQGEMIWAILEYYSFSGDRKFLEKYWDNVYRDLKFTKKLREQRLTDAYNVDDPDTRRFYGILPQSRSHEGYWFAHSYWDDWWALKGWKDAEKIARILNKDKKIIDWIDEEYNSFLVDLCNSIKTTAAFKKVDYISGCAEKGDYDPTSAAVAINYSGELHHLEKLLQPYLDNTFNSYYKDRETWFKPNASFHYTPYEARNVPVFIYKGQKERALNLLRFLLSCSRPYHWYQLAEVVNSDPHNPNYLGDVPHNWVGAEMINSIRDLFVYEIDGEKLVIGAGIDQKWLDRDKGISVNNLPTYYGKINYRMKKKDDGLIVEVSGKSKPENGFILKNPFLNKNIKSVTINNKKHKDFTDKEVLFETLPAKIMIKY